MSIIHSFKILFTMAEQIVVTVYTINGKDMGAGESRSFPSGRFRSRAQSGIVTSANGTRLYGILEEYPDSNALKVGSRFNAYGVVQTPTELAALANAALA